jgi:ABC-type Fe3+/spermidine/putrescine transport system ATPase subunit
MAHICLTDVCTSFLKSVSLSVGKGECVAVVGPSGAGKTTLLRVIVGLARHSGEVEIDGKSVRDVPPYLRNIGYVSQDLHLFPHLTVEGNLLLAMGRLRMSKKQKRDKAREIADLLRIERLIGRRPERLSGGEKQRAALARALACTPRALLLDEPFSKLDFRTNRYLRKEFKKLQSKLKLTTILVTHNLEEAREMAERQAVMHSGSLELVDRLCRSTDACGFPFDGFLENENWLACSDLRSVGNGLTEVEWAGLRLLVPADGKVFSRICIPSGKIRVQRDPFEGSQINRFEGTVTRVMSEDSVVRLAVAVGGETIRVEVDPEKWNEYELYEGDRIHGQFRLRDLRTVP